MDMTQIKENISTLHFQTEATIKSLEEKLKNLPHTPAAESIAASILKDINFFKGKSVAYLEIYHSFQT